MFNHNEHRSPSQKSQKAVLNIIARLAGCGFLVYFIVKLMTAPKEQSPDTGIAMILGIVMIVLGIVVIGMTVLDGLRGIKTGRFKTSTYEEEDLAAYLAQKETEASTCACEDAQQELDAHTDDKAEHAAPDKDNEDQ